MPSPIDHADGNMYSLSSSTDCSLLIGKRICTSGCSSREEAEIATIIQSLGGKHSSTFSRDVYCLILRRVGSKKHEIALTLKIPVVTRDWLYNCTKERVLLDLIKYQPPLFCGLKISCTQLELAQRQVVQAQIVMHGGEYCPSLVLGQSTHLVALRPDGDKYINAKSWRNVHIVTPEWIDKCLESNRMSSISLVIILIVY